MAVALEKKWPLYLSTKNTILKKYDGRYAIYYLFLIYSIYFLKPLIFDSHLINYILLLVKDLRTYFKKFMRQAGNPSMRLLVFGE
jgi:isocitrate dehydrogenase